MDTPPSLAAQSLPRDPTRLVPAKAKKPSAVPKLPLGVKQAAASWQQLHGHKFARNAGRFGRKGA